MPYSIIFFLILAILFLASTIRILKEYERGVIFRLGGSLSAGRCFVLSGIRLVCVC